MQLTTPVSTPDKRIGISHKDQMMLIGSCFADSIGNKLTGRAFNIDTNPFGVQYNPLSIATVLDRIADGTPFNEHSPEVFLHNGLWSSILHHSSFSSPEKEKLISGINARLEKAHARLKELDIIFITLGTAYAYSRKSDNRVVGNCHKLPGNLFERRLLSIEEICRSIAGTIDKTHKTNPKTKFIFTVSPIRHLRDGAHDNQKSKATLILAIDHILELYPECASYFPAYEIMLDELRDYRFYADDMIHPSGKAVEYIWEKFAACYFSKETIVLNDRVEEIMRGIEHKPFNASSPQYRQFIETLLQKIETVCKEHPYLDLKKETGICNTLLRR